MSQKIVMFVIYLTRNISFWRNIILERMLLYKNNVDKKERKIYLQTSHNLTIFDFGGKLTNNLYMHMCSGILADITIESKNIWQCILQFLEYSILAQMIMNEICIFIHWSSVAYSNFLFQSLYLYMMVMKTQTKIFLRVRLC